MIANAAPQSRRRRLLLCVLLTLLIAVVGALAVKWFRPSVVYHGEMASAITTASFETAPANQSPKERAEAISRLLLRKWHIKEKPLVFGDMDVEFRNDGTGIRHYSLAFVPDKVTHFNYTVTPEGELHSSDPDVTLKLALVSDDRLCISWNGRSVVEYNRGPTILQEIGTIALVVTILFLLLYLGSPS